MFLILFFIIPIVEMYLLIEVSQQIDVIPTVGLVMLTAVVGVAILRQQGFATLSRGIRRLNRGELPAMEMLEGLLLAVAGAFLITPGFLTDSIGFLITIAPTRRLLVAYLLRRLQKSGTASRFTRSDFDAKYSGRTHSRRSPDVIEGEFKEKN